MWNDRVSSPLFRAKFAQTCFQYPRVGDFNAASLESNFRLTLIHRATRRQWGNTMETQLSSRDAWRETRGDVEIAAEATRFREVSLLCLRRTREDREGNTPTPSRGGGFTKATFRETTSHSRRFLTAFVSLIIVFQCNVPRVRASSAEVPLPATVPVRLAWEYRELIYQSLGKESGQRLFGWFGVWTCRLGKKRKAKEKKREERTTLISFSSFLLLLLLLLLLFLLEKRFFLSFFLSDFLSFFLCVTYTRVRANTYTHGEM